MTGNPNSIHPHIIRQMIFLGLIVALIIFLARELHFLIVPGLGAITLYVLLRNIMIHLVERYKWKKWLAALTIILLTMVIIMVPLAWLINFGYSKIYGVIQHPEVFKSSFTNITNYINRQFSINIIDSEYVTKLNNFLLDIAQKTIGTTINTIGAFGMMYLILYFMLYQFVDIENWIRNRLPFRHVNSNKLIKKTHELIITTHWVSPLWRSHRAW